MTESLREKYDVTVVHDTAGIQCGCKCCKKILATGTWMIVITNHTNEYFLGESPPLKCCKEEKQIIRLLNQEDDAVRLQNLIVKKIERDEGIDNLVLYPCSIVLKGVSQ